MGVVSGWGLAYHWLVGHLIYSLAHLLTIPEREREKER